MNKLVLPPSPNWFQSSILACSSDNTLIYGSRQDLVVVNPPTADEAADIRIFPYSHGQKVLSVAINKNWGQPNKYCVTTSDDKVVCLWDISEYKLKGSHTNHLTNDENIVGANFAGEEKVVSVAENGRIVIWHIGTKEEVIIKDLFGPKAIVTSLSVCPHASWLAGFGMKNGLVVVVDLRKTGKVLHKLRGHDKSVISLSWCPVSVNIFPKHPKNTVKNGNQHTSQTYSANEKNVDSIIESIDGKAVDVKEVKSSISVEPNLTKQKICEVDSNRSRKEGSSNNEEPKEKDLELPKPEVQIIDASDSKCDNEKLSESQIGSREQADSRYTDVTILTTEEMNKDQGDVKALKASDAEKATPECEDSTIQESNICQKEENKTPEVVGNDSVGLTESAVDQTINKECLKVEDGKPNSGSEKDEVPVDVFIIEPVEEEARKEFLLASSGKEGNIYIWRAGTDGRMQTFFSAVNVSRKFRNRNDQRWITVNWITPNWLLSSSMDGSLLKWILPRPLERDSKPLVIHKDHRGDLYSIAGPCKFYSGDSWDNDDDITVWTSGRDRLLLNTGINAQRKNFANYPTFGGSVCSLVASPITPTRLALGLTDGTIRVWELGQPHTVHIEITCFYQKVHSKVTTLAWHPSKEFLLAFGTLEGRIGILDTSNPSKPPKLLPHYFKSVVHKIEWGPLSGGNMENLGLYAIGEGRIVIFNEKVDKGVEKVLTPEKLFVYNFAWNPDYSMLLVSIRSGELLIYTSDLKLSRTIYLQQKGLSNIVWHPYGKPGDIDSESSACWFAITVPSDHNVYVYDLSKLCEGGDNNVQPELTLEGQFEVVTCLAWDCLQGDKLVAAGEGGVAQVWNTVTNTLVASYIEPYFENICSIMWSPLDSNHVISCSKNGTLVIWNITEHPPINKKDLMAQHKKHLQSTAKGKPSAVLPKVEKPAPVATKPNKHCNNLLPLHSLSQNSASKHCANMKRLLKWVENKKSNSEALMSVDSGPTAVDCLHIFGSKEQMYEILAKNEECHRKKKKPNLLIVSSLFKGDIAEYIKEAIEQKAVTQQMIALAPMVSTKVWQEACQTYAEQLNESQDSDPMDTAMYYLACHKVQDAINCLCSNDLYKEALALVKCRFPEDDSLVPDILRKWAKYAFLQGDFETSALCYIVLGDYEEAAKALFRRSDQTLEIAVELAELSGNKDLEKAVRARYELFKPDFEHNQELLPKSIVVMGNKLDTSNDHVKMSTHELEQQDTIEMKGCGANSSAQKLVKCENDNCVKENTKLSENEVVALKLDDSGILGSGFANGNAEACDTQKQLSKSNEPNAESTIMKTENGGCCKLTEKCEKTLPESVDDSSGIESA